MSSRSTVDARCRHTEEKIQIERGTGLASHSSNRTLLTLHKGLTTFGIGENDAVHSADAHRVVKTLRRVPRARLEMSWTIPWVSRILRDNKRRTFQYDERHNWKQFTF